MIELLHGDCLRLMKEIPDKSIDMICCDLPYGTTGVACKNLNRNFIGMELDFNYYMTAYNRIMGVGQ